MNNCSKKKTSIKNNNYTVTTAFSAAMLFKGGLLGVKTPSSALTPHLPPSRH